MTTETEILIINALRKCVFLPGSFDKRFVRGLSSSKLSDSQRWWLYKLGYKYRRQINDFTLLNVCAHYLERNDKPENKIK